VGVTEGGGFESVRRPPALEGRFVVFSGGKFELRKAQDIVVGPFPVCVCERERESVCVCVFGCVRE
jgi:hypothetical protein